LKEPREGAVVIQFVWTGVPPSALSTLGMVIIIAAGQDNLVHEQSNAESKQEEEKTYIITWEYEALYRRTYLVVDGEEDLQRAFGLTLGRGFHSTGCVHPLSETRRGLQDRLHLVLPGDYIRLLFFLFGLPRVSPKARCRSSSPSTTR
jgi:hypothetical protein